MSGYQGYPQDQWPGDYDDEREWSAPGTPPDGRYSEMSMADSAPMSRAMPGGGETWPAPYSEEGVILGPKKKMTRRAQIRLRRARKRERRMTRKEERAHSETVGLPARRQEVDRGRGMTYEDDRSRTFFVFNLMPNTTASDLFQYFVKFGDLMMFDVFCNNEGNCTGSGIVQFVNEEAAAAALAVQPHFINKKQIIISHDRKDDPQTNADVKKSLEEHKLFVTDIPLYVSEEDLCGYFSQWGNISFCDVSGRTNERTRHVFVSYTSYEDAVKCLETTHNYGNSVINVAAAVYCKALKDHVKANNSECGIGLTRRNSLFVSNIPDDMFPEDLEEHFSMLGELVSCVMGGQIYGNNNFCFVRYKEQEDALRALIMPHIVKNQRLFVRVSERRSRPLMRASQDSKIMAAIEQKVKKCYLCVPYFNDSTTEADLYEHFKTYGYLVSCMIVPTKHKPFAHLAYACEADAARCFHDEHYVNNEKLILRWSDFTKWGGNDTRGMAAKLASPQNPPRDHPDDNRRTGRAKLCYKRRRARRRRLAEYAQNEDEFDLEDGCEASWD